MPRPEQIPIQKHITQEELQKRIKTLETNTKILQRLYFIIVKNQTFITYAPQF
jgi:hypothetical protein